MFMKPQFPDRGFRVGDNLGAATILGVDLFNSVVRIRCDRVFDISNSPWVQYADKTVHSGNGNICDSSTLAALDNSTITAQPYPMWNWLTAFRMAVASDV